MSSKSLGVLTLDLLVQTGGFEAGMDKASRVADRETRRMEREAKARAQAIEQAFTKMGAGLVAAWGSLNLVQSVKGAADFAAELSKLSQRTGLAVEQLSALNYAASLNGAALSDLEQGLKGLANKMGDAAKGPGEAADAFRALGVSATDASGKLRPVDKVLLDIADKFSKMEDGAGKAAIAAKLMEESGVRLIPTLNKGRQGLADLRDEAEKLGAVIGTDFAAASAELNQNLARLQTMGKGFATTIAAETVPAINELAVGILDAAKETKAFETAGAAARVVIETLAITGANVGFVFTGVGREIGGIAAQLNALGHGDFKAFSAIGEMMKKDAEEARRQLDEFERRIMNPGKPATEQGGNTPKLAAPIIKPAPPKSTYEPLADSAKAYADALQSLLKAQRDADTAGLDLSNTQRQMLDVMTSPEWLQMPDSWKAVVAEQAEFTIAAEQAADAQKRLNDLLAATPTAQLEKSRNTMEFLAKAFDEGKISAEQFSEAAQAALGMLNDKGSETGDKFEMVISNAFENAGSALADFVMTGKANFGDLVSTMIRDLLRLEYQMQMSTLYKSMGGMSGMLSGITGLFNLSSGSSATGLASLPSSVNATFAKGGVFNSPSLHSYVNQVHDTPKLFAFAQGGVFAEAGPEAVMPLTRGSDGKLGVMSHGGGAVTVNVINNSGAQTKQSERPDGRGGKIIDILIEQVEAKIAGNISTGNGPVPTALQSSYGLNRTAGAY